MKAVVKKPSCHRCQHRRWTQILSLYGKEYLCSDCNRSEKEKYRKELQERSLSL